MTPTRFPVIPFLLAGVAGTAPALAQSTGAEAAIEAGLALRDRGDLDGAARAFQRAWQEGHSPRAEAQFAITEQGMGRWSSADRHLREALAAAAHPWIQQNRTRLEQAIATIATHLGSVLVRGGVDGAAVLFNGQALTTLPMATPARVDIGSGVIEVRAEGYHPWSRPVTVTAGGLFVETALLAPLMAQARAAAPETPPLPTASGGSTQRVLAWTALGLAGAGLAVGVTWNIIREGHFQDYNGSVCGQPEIDAVDQPRCDAALSTLNQQADTAFPWIVAGYVTAGAFAVTSLVLHLTAPSGREPGRSAGWGCALGATGRGIQCAWAF